MVLAIGRIRFAWGPVVLFNVAGEVMSAQVSVMPRSGKRNDEPVKVAAEVLRMGRIIAAIEDVTLAELVSETLRPIFEAKLAEHQRKGFAPKPPEKPKK